MSRCTPNEAATNVVVCSPHGKQGRMSRCTRGVAQCPKPTIKEMRESARGQLQLARVLLLLLLLQASGLLLPLELRLLEALVRLGCASLSSIPSCLPLG